MLKLALILLSVASLVPGHASADTSARTLSSSIDHVFAAYAGRGTPGCAAGVIYEGKYIHKAGYGLANLEHGIPITVQSVFRTGSVGKQFTAMAIAILAQRGELDLDTDVHTYLPDLMDYGRKVSVRQMVHHLAGMGDYDHAAFRKADGSAFRFGNEDYMSNEEFYSAVSRADLILPPGAKWEYSNLAYFLLGHWGVRRCLRE